MELSDKTGIKIINAAMIANARRTNAHLLDDLEKLTKIGELKGDSVVNTIMAEPADENLMKDMDDPTKSTPKKDNKKEIDYPGEALKKA